METDRPTSFDDERLSARCASAGHGLDTLSKDLASHEGLAILGTLAASIAHEFASLLTPLKMQAQLVQRRPDNPDAANRLADEVVGAANRGVALIDAILALAPTPDRSGDPAASSASESGAAPGSSAECSTGNIDDRSADRATGSGGWALHRSGRAAEPSDLETLARRVMNSMGDGPGAVLHLEPGLRVDAPDAIVERVLSNLIDNARRAIAEGGSISIAAKRVTPTAGSGANQGVRINPDTAGGSFPEACEDGLADRQSRTGSDARAGECSTGNIGGPAGGVVRIEVCDSGCGMGRETLRRLFDPFVSGPRGGRQGLGLAIVAGLVRQHGGTIRCESGEERGTVFAVDLPEYRGRSASNAA